MLLELPQAEGVALVQEDVLHDGSLDPVLLVILPVIRLLVLFALLDRLQLTLNPLQSRRLAAVRRVWPRKVALVTGGGFDQAADGKRFQGAAGPGLLLMRQDVGATRHRLPARDLTYGRSR